MHFRADLHQFLEINDLMVAPIADVRPGIMGFGKLPIDALARDAVRVVSIDGSGIQESADHAFDIFRIGIGKCFPVLKNISPVAFIA